LKKHVRAHRPTVESTDTGAFVVRSMPKTGSPPI
jgi:hypothetical protein